MFTYIANKKEIIFNYFSMGGANNNYYGCNKAAFA
jgi:hypothetical protein